MSKVVIKGTVLKLEEVSGEGSNGKWTRQTLVVKTSNEYNNTVPIGFYKKGISVSEGTQVEVEAYVNGREYQGKYYPQLDGSEVKVVGQQQQQGMQPNSDFQYATSANTTVPQSDTDSLPF